MTLSGKVFLAGFAVYAGTCVVASVAPEHAESVEGVGVLALAAMMFSGIAWLVVKSKTTRVTMTDEEKARINAQREQKVAHWEEVRAANTIVSTAIVDTTMKSKTKASVGSSVVRGAVGSVFGPVGTIVGAATPKKTTITKAKTVTFSIRYANGECKLETVKNGSARFKELAKYIA